MAGHRPFRQPTMQESCRGIYSVTAGWMYGRVREIAALKGVLPTRGRSGR